MTLTRSFQPNAVWHYTNDVIEFDTEETRRVLSCFDLRAHMFSEPDDYVVVTSGDYADQIRWSFERGVGCHPDHVVDHVSKVPKGLKLRLFSGTSRFAHEEAHKHGYEVKAPPQHTCDRANDKSYFQDLSTKQRSYIPQGYVCDSEESAKDAVRRLHDINRDARIKDPKSASGKLQQVIRRGEAIELDPGLMGRDEYVVQVNIYASSDASVQWFITSGGEIDMQIVTGQHVRDGKEHFGNFFPSGFTRDLRRKMLKAAKFIVGEFKRDLGIYGPGSVDFVIDPARQMVWAIEVNFRVTAAFYAYMASRRWNNGRVKKFDMRSFAVPGDMRIEDFDNKFGSLLFRRDKGEGFLPFCFLPEHGMSYGVCYANEEGDLGALTEEVERVKATLIS